MASDGRGVVAMTAGRTGIRGDRPRLQRGTGRSRRRVPGRRVRPGTTGVGRGRDTTVRSAIRRPTPQRGFATGCDPPAAREGPGGHRGRWCHRHQRRLPPGHSRLVRCRPAGAGRAHVGTTWHAAGLITSAGMVDETALFMSRYSRDLYERLEQETGLSTGFRAVGHISVATNPDRMDAFRREAKFVHGFGVEDHELSTAEISAYWPMLKTEDVVGGFYVPTRAGPTPSGWPCRWRRAPGPAVPGLSKESRPSA